MLVPLKCLANAYYLNIPSTHHFGLTFFLALNHTLSTSVQWVWIAGVPHIHTLPTWDLIFWVKALNLGEKLPPGACQLGSYGEEEIMIKSPKDSSFRLKRGRVPEVPWSSFPESWGDLGVWFLVFSLSAVFRIGHWFELESVTLEDFLGFSLNLTLRF